MLQDTIHISKDTLLFIVYHPRNCAYLAGYNSYPPRYRSLFCKIPHIFSKMLFIFHYPRDHSYLARYYLCTFTMLFISSTYHLYLSRFCLYILKILFKLNCTQVWTPVNCNAIILHLFACMTNGTK